jgi:ankyrin repeat protein
MWPLSRLAGFTGLTGHLTLPPRAATCLAALLATAILCLVPSLVLAGESWPLAIRTTSDWMYQECGVGWITDWCADRKEYTDTGTLPDTISVGQRIQVENTSSNKKFDFFVGSISLYVYETDVKPSRWGRRTIPGRKKGDRSCTLYEKPRAKVGDGSWISRIIIRNCDVAPSPSPAFYEAISAGRLDEVKRLTANMDLSRPTSAEWPDPLLLAILKDREAIARYLIDRGASVNGSFQGLTPLFIAIQKRQIELARLMIQKGADINADVAGGSPFLLAVSLGTYADDEIEDLFVRSGQKPDVNATDPRKRTVLMWAIHHNPALAMWLLKQGARVNTLDSEGRTPLQHAVYRGEVDIVRALLAKKADSDIRGDGYQTPLMEALAYFRQSPTSDYLEIARLLIHSGIDANARDKMRQTPLMFAAAVNQSQIAEELLDRGADVNALDMDGRTALMLGAGRGYHKIVALLIKRGAKVNVRDKDGKTALVWARENGRRDVEALLLATGKSD